MIGQQKYPLKTFVYVDAFNLYYGSLKGTPYKWLNIRKCVSWISRRIRLIALKFIRLG
jgi:hypothetical protein